MSDREALLRAILATPDDDAPRLVYADWLEEHEWYWEATHLRQAVANPEGRWWQLTLALLRGLHPPAAMPEWTRRLWRGKGETCRGFVRSVELEPSDFLEIAADLFAFQPVSRVQLNGTSPDRNFWSWNWGWTRADARELPAAHVLPKAIYDLPRADQRARWPTAEAAAELEPSRAVSATAAGWRIVRARVRTAHDGREALMRAILEAPDDDVPAARLRRLAGRERLARRRLTSGGRSRIRGSLVAPCRRRSFRAIIRRPPSRSDAGPDRPREVIRGFVRSVELEPTHFLEVAPDLFALQPIARVQLTGARPERIFWAGTWAWASGPARQLPRSHVLPKSIFECLDQTVGSGWPSAETAELELSRACVRYGRRLAGLSPPVWM